MWDENRSVLRCSSQRPVAFASPGTIDRISIGPHKYSSRTVPGVDCRPADSSNRRSRKCDCNSYIISVAAQHGIWHSNTYLCSSMERRTIPYSNCIRRIISSWSSFRLSISLMWAAKWEFTKQMNASFNCKLTPTPPLLPYFNDNETNDHWILVYEWWSIDDYPEIKCARSDTLRRISQHIFSQLLSHNDDQHHAGQTNRYQFLIRCVWI